MKRLIACVLFGACIAGCSKVQTQTSVNGEHVWTQSGVLRVALQQDLKNLNPLLASNTTDVLLARLMFEPLLTASPNGDPLPMLATQVPSLRNGGISQDGLTITYHLRKDVKWSDGVSLTSKDVKFSWQAIMNSNNNVVTRHGYDLVQSIDTPDPYTVVVHLKQKFAPFVNTFFAESDAPLEIVPEHVLAKYPNINQIPFNNEPNVSDGPFRFAEWSRGDHITLTRNDNFFLGKPKLERIILKIIPDENTSVNLLKTHGIDWIFQASIDNYPEIKAIPDTKIVWFIPNGYEYLQINTQRPFLSDVRVRQAIAYAIDKKQLVDSLTFGQDQIATADQPPWIWAYDPSLKSLPHDIAKARALLTQAGFAPGPNGVMRKNGQSLTLVLVTDNSNATRRKVVTELQAMLAPAGIRAEIKYFPGEQLFAPAGEGGILQGGKFDLSSTGWFAGIDPDDSTQLTCKNVAPAGYNFSRYCNPEMEAAQATALSHYDRATRKVAYAKIQHLIVRDVPEVVYWYDRYMEPISVDFKGFDPNPVEEAWNAWQWSI